MLTRMVIGLGLEVAAVSSPAAEFDQSHQLLDQVLHQYVKDARVDYKALKASPEELNRYLAQLAAVGKSEFKQWNEKQQLAFLINAYNASTLKLITDHYPVKSIKDIGSFLNGPWDQPVVKLFGQTITLNTLEHGILRKDYSEPRIHFALVCAAKGCPPLRSEAYLGARLDEQLDDQAKSFLAASSKNRVDAQNHVVYLSPIFKWYGEDFVKKAGSVLNFLQNYFPERDARELRQGEFKIKYTDYDWSLNESSTEKK
jgi:hypothetical protein